MVRKLKVEYGRNSGYRGELIAVRANRDIRYDELHLNGLLHYRIGIYFISARFSFDQLHRGIERRDRSKYGGRKFSLPPSRTLYILLLKA